MRAGCIRWEPFRPGIAGRSGTAGTGMICAIFWKGITVCGGLLLSVLQAPGTFTTPRTEPTLRSTSLPAMMDLPSGICIPITKSTMRPMAGITRTEATTIEAGTAVWRGKPTMKRFLPCAGVLPWMPLRYWCAAGARPCIFPATNF